MFSLNFFPGRGGGGTTDIKIMGWATRLTKTRCSNLGSWQKKSRDLSSKFKIVNSVGSLKGISGIDPQNHNLPEIDLTMYVFLKNDPQSLGSASISIPRI